MDDFAAMMEAPAFVPQVVEREPFIRQEITLPSGTDIRPTALSLVTYQEKVKLLVARAREIQVDDDAGRKEATALALQAKNIRLQVEAIKKSPAFLAAETFIKEVRHLCTTLTDPLKNQVEAVCKTKLTNYSKKQILEQQRLEAEAREKARQEQAKLDEEARALREQAEERARAAAKELAQKEAAGQIDEGEKATLEQTVAEETAAAESIVAPKAVVQVQPRENVVRTDVGSSFTKARPRARLVDESLVERKYLIVDMKAVQKDVDAGVRNIPGFIIEDEYSTSIRG